MEENQMIQVQRPTQPEPWRDLDDLIFQGDGWLARRPFHLSKQRENASARWERRRKKTLEYPVFSLLSSRVQI